jgi:hypothetical protein
MPTSGFERVEMQVKQNSPYELICFLQPKCAHYFPEAVGRPELYGQTVVVTRELTYLQHGLIARRLIEVASSRVSWNSQPSRPISLLYKFRSDGLLEQIAVSKLSHTPRFQSRLLHQFVVSYTGRQDG